MRSGRLSRDLIRIAFVFGFALVRAGAAVAESDESADAKVVILQVLTDDQRALLTIEGVNLPVRGLHLFLGNRPDPLVVVSRSAEAVVAELPGDLAVGDYKLLVFGGQTGRSDDDDDDDKVKTTGKRSEAKKLRLYLAATYDLTFGPLPESGPPGPQGKQGSPGAQGGQGPPGPAGQDGKDGEPGIAGATGPQGPTGPPGIAGLDGKDGKDGEPGIAGETGPQGPTGPQGIAGLDGKDGKDGEPGIAGATGPQGLAGLDGKDGKDGKDGQDGQDGAPGTAGATGPQGPTGPQGLVGPAGPSGAAGQQGPPGIASVSQQFGVAVLLPPLPGQIQESRTGCDGKTLIGGGYSTTPPGMQVLGSFPSPDNQWIVQVINNGPATVGLRVDALCATVAK